MTLSIIVIRTGIRRDFYFSCDLTRPITDIPKKKNLDTASNCKKNKRETRDKRHPDKIPLSFSKIAISLPASPYAFLRREKYPISIKTAIAEHVLAKTSVESSLSKHA